jgi:hypothetical protein
MSLSGSRLDDITVAISLMLRTATQSLMSSVIGWVKISWQSRGDAFVRLDLRSRR